jgi:dethiobiotin synthetase
VSNATDAVGARRVKPQSIFVTGTDTEIGKTTVACAIARQWVRAGVRVGAMKPVAAGLINGKSEDLLALEAACNFVFPFEDACPYAMPDAIAPHLAALRAGVEISAAVIAQKYGKSAPQVEAMIVEGAGGARVPINSSEDMLDIAAACRLPVLMVVGMKLGCINHARLTADAIASRGLVCLGWVANVLDPNMPFLHENIETLKNCISAPFWGVCSFRGDQLSATL